MRPETTARGTLAAGVAAVAAITMLCAVEHVSPPAVSYLPQVFGLANVSGPRPANVPGARFSGIRIQNRSRDGPAQIWIGYYNQHGGQPVSLDGR